MEKDLIKVLLVEDDEVDRRLVERLLAKCSQPVEFAVESVGSMSAAAVSLGGRKYDLVLLDLGLPDSSGIETVQKINEVNQRTPIVVLTGSDDEETGLLAIKSGATDYLVKGQSLENLLVRTMLYALEREKEKKLILETNRRLQDTSQELFRAKQELEKKANALQKTQEELELRLEERIVELSKANELLTKLKQSERALQASEANLLKVIVTSPDGIVVVDRDGTVQFVNPTAESLFGCKAEELLGELFGLPLVKDEAMEVDIVNYGVGPGIAEMRVVETEWNGKKANLILLQDITERKLAEERLIEANEKLKEYNQLKDEFISTASHELRTPLSIIMAAIRIILDEIPGEIVEKQRDVLTTAMKNVQGLSKIVDSLLSIAKIEAGKLDLQKTVVNICELIKDTVSNCKALAQEKSLSLDFEVPEQRIDICLDPDEIKEVLMNLISNSIKFTSEGGWIKVTCTDRDGEVLVSVRDSGVGIAEEDIPKLFDKFTQFGRKAGPGEKGTGLGLAIVKKLIVMHGGKIDVESEVNQGTTFTITLPLTTEATAEALPAEMDEFVETTLVNH
jgi:signal transduction histidine kinase